MAEVLRTEKTVTRFTLDISEDEAKTMSVALLADGSPDAILLRDALLASQSVAVAASTPIAVGDRVRVTAVEPPRYVNGMFPARNALAGVIAELVDTDPGTDLPYRVRPLYQDRAHWVHAVEKVEV